VIKRLVKNAISVPTLVVLGVFLFSPLDAHEETSEDIVQPLQTDSTSDIPSPPARYCYFHPPKGWDIVDRRHAGPQIQMAFIKKAKKEGFCPSLNLAIENVEGTLNEYLNDVKAIYEQDRKNHWRKLGKVRTHAGEAQLTEIDTLSALGSVRMLQLIFLKEGQAYIITAAALKNDFCRYYRDFQDAFHSLTVTADLFEAIPQLERRTALKQEIDKLLLARTEEEFEKKHLPAFQKKLEDEFDDMGSFWQALVLKEFFSDFYLVINN